MLAICAADKPVVFKAPKTSSKAESVSQGTKPGAQTRHKKPLTSSKQPSVSSKEATKGGSSKAPTGSKTGHSKKRKESSSAMDSNPSQPLVSTPDVMLQQIPQLKLILDYLLMILYLSNKLEDLAKLLSHVQPSFNDLESPKDDLVIVVNDSDEDEDDEVHATKNVETKDISVLKSSSPRSSQVQELTNQLKELLIKSLKIEFLNILSTHDFSSSLPTKLKNLPSKFNDLTEEWELPAEFLAMPSQVKMVQAKLKTLDALPSLLNKVTNALNQFAQAITSKKTRGDSVPSAGQVGTQPAEGEKNTN
ncbi:hypothetical protein Tco_1348113 [Tanacetum coccineum]